MKLSPPKPTRSAAAVLLALGVAAATTAVTASPAAASDTVEPSTGVSASTLNVHLDAVCFSGDHLVTMVAFAPAGSPYPRTWRVVYRNNPTDGWSVATDWSSPVSGPLGLVQLSWSVPSALVGTHQYAVETAVQTSAGWQTLGTVLASTRQGSYYGFGDVHDSPVPSWCYA